MCRDVDITFVRESLSILVCFGSSAPHNGPTDRVFWGLFTAIVRRSVVHRKLINCRFLPRQAKNQALQNPVDRQHDIKRQVCIKSKKGNPSIRRSLDISSQEKDKHVEIL